MIIDNSKDITSIYADTLRCAGYSVECLTDEEMAINKICKQMPEVVLLDVLMPKINGLHLLDMIVKDPCNKKTKVIMLTNVSDSAIQQKAMKAGAKDYIVKSEVGISELLRRIDKVLT
jgi:DNA-binding response OmpR family regulator